MWPGSTPATCSDISERLLRASDISIRPPGRRGGYAPLLPETVHAGARCFVFHLGSLTWKISSRGRREAGEDSPEEAGGSISGR